MPVLDCDVEVARAALEAAGAEITPGKTEHERYHAELGEAHAVAYDDSLVVQGSRPVDITAVVALFGWLVGQNDTFNFFPLRYRYTPCELRFRGLHPGSTEPEWSEAIARSCSRTPT